MPKAGDVLFHKEWVFDDGTKGRKLLVVLNTPPDIDTPFLVVKTTSNSDFYKGVNVGCNLSKRVFFVPKSDEPCFDCDTYIQLHIIGEITTEQLLRGCFAKVIIPLETSVSAKCFSQIKACLKNLKNDISTKHWKLIFH
jgi:hypothetical protein